MKKLISLLLILCMACMLIPAMADESVVGTWYLKDLSMGGQTIAASLLGMSMSLEFKEDGTLTIVTAYGDEPETDTGTWTQDGSAITITGEGSDGPQSFTLQLADGVLSMEQEGSLMNFTQEEPAAAGSRTATVAAESEEAFLGTWQLTSVEIMGQEVPTALLSSFGLDMNLTLTVEAGKATLIAAVAGESTEEAFATSFADGKLTLSKEGAEESISMALTEDGRLAFILPISEQTFSVYLSPAEAAEAPAA